MTSARDQQPPLEQLAHDVVDALRARGLTVAVAESLTGGLVMATLIEIPGVSDVLRGGAVTYATDTKASELGVDDDLLQDRGPFDPDVAVAMARGVRRRWRSDVGIATTGVAGPEPQDGHPVGEVYLAVADPAGDQVQQLGPVPDLAPDSGVGLQTLAGSADSEQVRSRVRQEAVRATLELVLTRLGSL